jgi:hypothetical protein
MTLVKDNIYSYTTTYPYKSCIFSDNGNNQASSQTWAAGHLYNKSGDQGVYNPDDTEQGGNEGGETTVDYSGYYVKVIGVFNKWTDGGVNPTTEGAAKQSGLAIGTSEFRLEVWTGSENINYSTSSTLAQNEWVTLPVSSESMTIAGATAGQKFDVEFNCATAQVKVTPVESSEPTKLDFYLKGASDPSNWDNTTFEIPLTTTDYKTYTYTATDAVSGEWKVSTSDWTTSFGVGDSQPVVGTLYNLTNGGYDNNITTTIPAGATVTFTYNEGATSTLLIEAAEQGGEDPVVTTTGLILTGTFDADEQWAATSEKYAMTQADDTNVYTFTLDEVAAGTQFKIKTNEDNWNTSWGGSESTSAPAMVQDKGNGVFVIPVDDTVDGKTFPGEVTITCTTEGTNVKVHATIAGTDQGYAVPELWPTSGSDFKPMTGNFTDGWDYTYTDQVANSTLEFQFRAVWTDGGTARSNTISYVVGGTSDDTQKTPTQDVVLGSDMNAWPTSSVNFKFAKDTKNVKFTFVRNDATEGTASTLTVTGDVEADPIDYTQWYVTVCGEFNEWLENSGKQVAEDGISVQENLAIGNGRFQIKVWNEQDGDKYYADGTIAQDEWVKLTGNYSNMYIKDATAGQKFNVSFNCATNEIKVVSAEVAEVADLTLSGTFNDWAKVDDNYKMTQDGNVYTYEFASEVAAGTEFKIKTNEDNWNTSWGGTAASAESAPAKVQDKGNGVFEIEATDTMDGGTFPSAVTITCTTEGTDVKVHATYNDSSLSINAQQELYSPTDAWTFKSMTGNSTTGWDYTFTDQVANSTLEFQFRGIWNGGAARSNTISYVVGGSSGDSDDTGSQAETQNIVRGTAMTATEGSSVNFRFPGKTRNAVVTFDRSTATMTVAGDVDYIVSGTFNSWPETDDDYIMTANSDGSYTFELTLHLNAEFKIKTNEEGWDKTASWGAEGTYGSSDPVAITTNSAMNAWAGSDCNFLVNEELGTAKITFTPKSDGPSTIQVVKTTSGIEDVNADNLNADAVYYNLQGIRVVNPEAGQVYIMNRAGKVSKVIVR